MWGWGAEVYKVHCKKCAFVIKVHCKKRAEVEKEHCIFCGDGVSFRLCLKVAVAISL